MLLVGRGCAMSSADGGSERGRLALRELEDDVGRVQEEGRDDDDDEVLQVQAQQQAGPSQAVIIRQAVPPYGQRRGWKLTSLEDLGA